MTADPEQIRIAQETLRRMAADPDQSRIAQETLRRMTANPEVYQRLQRTLDALRHPAGLAQLASVLESVGFSEGAPVASSPGEDAEVKEAVSELRTALERWNADAAELSALAAGADSDDAFGWLDRLPTVVQVKLWLSVLDVLNGLLLFIGYLSPESVPIGAVVAAEVLIRLNRALLDRLDTKDSAGS